MGMFDTLTPEEAEMARAELRRKQREWRKNNPDKAKAIQARYWLKRAKQRQQNVQRGEQREAE